MLYLMKKNIILYCMKTEEGYYICNTYMYGEKMKFTDILNIIFNYYINFDLWLLSSYK